MRPARNQHLPSNDRPKPSNQIRIYLVGPTDTGKTCLQKRILTLPFPVNTSQTTTIDHGDLKVNEGTIQLWIYDTPGDKDNRAGRQRLYENANIIFFIIDYQHIKKHQLAIYDEIMQEFLGIIKKYFGLKPELRIIVNKSDLISQDTSERTKIKKTITDWLKLKHPKAKAISITIISAMTASDEEIEQTFIPSDLNALCEKIEKARQAKMPPWRRLETQFRDINTGQEAIQYLQNLMNLPDHAIPHNHPALDKDPIKTKKNIALEKLRALIKSKFYDIKHTRDLEQIYTALQEALANNAAPLSLITEGRKWPHKGQGPTTTYEKMSNMIAMAIVKLDANGAASMRVRLNLHGRWQHRLFCTPLAEKAYKKLNETQQSASQYSANFNSEDLSDARSLMSIHGDL